MSIQERHSLLRAYATYRYLETRTMPTIRGPRTIRLYAARWYNCYGGTIWATTIVLEAWEADPGKGFVDMRTLKAVQEGCCPPALEPGFIGGETEGGKAFFAAEEALKLHKRGYLGGRG